VTEYLPCSRSFPSIVSLKSCVPLCNPLYEHSLPPEYRLSKERRIPEGAAETALIRISSRSGLSPDVASRVVSMSQVVSQVCRKSGPYSLRRYISRLVAPSETRTPFSTMLLSSR